MNFDRLLFVLTVIAVVSSQFTGATSSGQANSTCRIISVSGSGASNALPDTAVVTMGVSARANSSIVALGQMNAKARQLLTILNQYNIPSANIQTSSLNLGPDYVYRNGSQ
jgi:hypothetical protein